MPRNKATGRTFEIRTLEDFLDVPVRRRAAMLRDFRTFLDLSAATRTFLEAVTDHVTGKPGAVTYKAEAFRWIDDGQRNFDVDILPPEVPSDA